jgi:rSAM/selenodomain-associated transferase 1
MVATNTRFAKKSKQLPAPMQTAHQILDPANPVRCAENVCALGVMTKAPRAGRVKTRLQPPLTPEEAAQLNICFLRDTAAAIKSACRADAVGIGVYTPTGSEAAYIDILPGEFHLIPQRGEDFGERLAFAVEDLFRCGFGSVCLIDSDSPTVSSEIYAQAVASLARSGDRAILGPSDDGGYYLIGLKQNHRELFDGIDWSTKRVLNQTIERAKQFGIEVELLPNGYDVDDCASLNRLCADLLNDRVAADFAPHTRRFLAALVAAKGGQRIFATQ